MVEAVKLGGLVLDLQVIRPDPSVEVDGQVLCAIDGEPLFRLADAATAAVVSFILNGRLVEEAVDDHDVLKHYAPGADLVDDFADKERRIPDRALRRVRSVTRPCLTRETLVVDDGLVTGLTLAAACRWARAEEVARLVAATPVGRVDGLARLRAEADLVVCPQRLEEIAVVGQAYDSFDPLDEWYLAGLLADAAGGPAE